jgi:8-oxo-dGTP pyrophosphatase MutT (NUDIX family)
MGNGDAVAWTGRVTVGRIEYLNDPEAPAPNSLVPACGVLAVDDRGAILLQRRRDTGQWALPMGKQELGETPRQCAIRETEEETGVRVEVTGLVGIFSDPGHIVAYTDGEVRQEYEVTFLARPVGGAPAENDEASAVAWFMPALIDGLDVHPTMRRQIAVYLERRSPHFD